MVSLSTGPSQFQPSHRKVDPAVAGVERSTPLIAGCAVKIGAFADCFVKTLRTIVPLLVEIITVQENTWPASEGNTLTEGVVVPIKRFGKVQVIEFDTEFFHCPGSQVRVPFGARFPEI